MINETASRIVALSRYDSSKSEALFAELELERARYETLCENIALALQAINTREIIHTLTSRKGKITTPETGPVENGAIIG